MFYVIELIWGSRSVSKVYKSENRCAAELLCSQMVGKAISGSDWVYAEGEAKHREYTSIFMKDGIEKRFYVVDGDEKVNAFFYGDEVIRTYYGFKPMVETMERIFGGNSVGLKVPKGTLIEWCYNHAECTVEDYVSDDLDGFLEYYNLDPKEIGADEFCKKFVTGLYNLVK